MSARPDQSLPRLLELARAGDRRQLDDAEQGELCRGLLALDEWLNRGGYWPERWAGRGVNLELGGAGQAVLDEVQATRDMFAGHAGAVLPAASPFLLVAQPIVPENTGQLIACVTMHHAEDPDPVVAVRKLRERLAAALAGIGEA